MTSVGRYWLAAPLYCRATELHALEDHLAEEWREPPRGYVARVGAYTRSSAHRAAGGNRSKHVGDDAGV